MKRKVLIVDDGVGPTRALKMGLERRGGFNVCVENDPHRAIDVALAFEPDIILMDVIMPDVDGRELVVEMRRLPAFESVPVVFLTGTIGHDELADVESGFGQNSVLPKPVRIDDLVMHVGMILDEAAAKAE